MDIRVKKDEIATVGDDLSLFVYRFLFCICPPGTSNSDGSTI